MNSNINFLIIFDSCFAYAVSELWPRFKARAKVQSQSQGSKPSLKRISEAEGGILFKLEISVVLVAKLRAVVEAWI